MPRLAQSVPKYRLHKPSRQAFVELNDHRHYLGPHGTKASRLEYDRLIGEWLQNGRIMRPRGDGGSDGLLVVELIVAYLNFAKDYYPKGSQLTSEYTAIMHVVRQLKLLYGRKHAVKFGPIAWQAVMNRMIDDGWARTTVNRQAGRIRADFQLGGVSGAAPGFDL